MMTEGQQMSAQWLSNSDDTYFLRDDTVVL